MAFQSIRFRIAVWYFAGVAVILAMFATGAWFAMKASIQEAVDHDLRQRIHDVRDFMGQELDQGQAELLEELQEHSLLGLGGGLLQLSSSDGRVLFRSGRLKHEAIDLPNPARTEVRVLSESVTVSGRSIRTAAQTVAVKGQRFLIQVAEPMDEFEESEARFERTLMILAPIFLLAATAVGFWMSTRVLAPVDRIIDDAHVIGATNLTTRVNVPAAQDELQRLAHTLNAMLDRIEAGMKRVVQFTADASHELRAPLTLIHTAAEYCLRRDRRREELVEAMRTIVRESDRTSRLVDDLLVLARADSAAGGIQFAKTDVLSTGRDASALAATLAETKKIDLSTEFPSDAVFVNADEQRLEQLWLILLDNAVKYTPEGGKIRFAMRTADSYIETMVSDTGIGIATSDLPHIYDRFWRADKVRSRNTGGSGLGLSIARWIVESHQGEIQIHSEAGGGTEVKVRLPLN